MSKTKQKATDYPWLKAVELAHNFTAPGNDWVDEIIPLSAGDPHWRAVILSRHLTRPLLKNMAQKVEESAHENWELPPRSLAAGIITHPVMLLTFYDLLTRPLNSKLKEWLESTVRFFTIGDQMVVHARRESRSIPLSRGFLKSLPKSFPEDLLREEVKLQISDDDTIIPHEQVKARYNQQMKKYGFAGPWTYWTRGIVALEENDRLQAFQHFLSGIEIIEGILYEKVPIKPWMGEERKTNLTEEYGLAWTYLLIRQDLTPALSLYGMLWEAERGIVQALNLVVNVRLMLEGEILNDIEKSLDDFINIHTSQIDPDYQLIELLTSDANQGSNPSQSLQAQVFQLLSNWDQKPFKESQDEIDQLGAAILAKGEDPYMKSAAFYAANLAGILRRTDLAKKLLEKFLKEDAKTWADKKFRLWAKELHTVLSAVEKGGQFFQSAIDLLIDLVEITKIGCLYMPEEDFLSWLSRSYLIYSGALTLIFPNTERSDEEEAELMESLVVVVASLQSLGKANFQLRKYLALENPTLTQAHQERVKLSSALAKYDFQVEWGASLDLGYRMMADRRSILDVMISDQIRRIDTKNIAQITAKDLRSAVGSSCLLYFMKYVPRNPYESTGYEKPKYCVLVMNPERAGMTYQNLGDAIEIDAEIEAFLQSIYHGDDNWSELADSVTQRLLHPISDLLECESWIICPAGSIGKLPFEILNREKGILVDQVDLRYVDSLWDLVSGSPTVEKIGNPLVIGDPNFNYFNPKNERLDLPSYLYDPKLIEDRKAGKVLPKAPFFPQLVETREEATEVAKLLKTKSLTGNDARESTLKSTASPRILHLATHGFYIKRSDEANAEDVDFMTIQFRGSEYTHPLLRSGIALAGANWYADEHVSADGDDDGILNGYDALELELSGTELAVLSACRTGINDSLGITGSLGLRFALATAGAKSQLTTLWPVYDTTTKDFMVSFYQALRKGLPKSHALREAQNRIRKDPNYGEHPYYWAGYLLYGNQEPINY